MSERRRRSRLRFDDALPDRFFSARTQIYAASLFHQSPSERQRPVHAQGLVRDGFDLGLFNSTKNLLQDGHHRRARPRVSPFEARARQLLAFPSDIAVRKLSITLPDCCREVQLPGLRASLQHEWSKVQMQVRSNPALADVQDRAGSLQQSERRRGAKLGRSQAATCD